MKKIITLAIVAATLLGLNISAQAQNYGTPTYLTVATNTPNLASYTGGFYIPGFSLTINTTNPAAFITNSTCCTLNLGQSNYLSLTNSFVYSAAVWGTNFQSNFPALWVPFTVTGFQRAIPGTGGTNANIQ